MMSIRLLKSARIRVGTEPVNISDALEAHRKVVGNASEVISSALAIEKQMETIIAFHFLGNNFEKRSFFQSVILGSDWCGFASKRKVLMAVLAQSPVLTGQERSDLDKILAKVMRFRNAFTHGEVVQSVQGIFLHYFGGEPKQRALTDEYWTQIELDFSEAHRQVSELMLKLGVVQQAEQAVEPDRREDAAPG